MSTPGVSLDSAISSLNQRVENARRTASELAAKTEPVAENQSGAEAREEGEGGINVFA